MTALTMFAEASPVYRGRFHRFVARPEDPEVFAEAGTWLESLLIMDEHDDGQAPFGWPDAAGSSLSVEANAKTLAFHAPVALIEGAWLQGINTPATSHYPQVCELFAAYLGLLGGDAARSPAHTYRGLMAQAGHALPPVVSPRFVLESGAGEGAYAWAALHLALGLAGSGHFDTVLGFCAGYATSSSNWRLAGLAPVERNARLQAFRDRIRKAWDGHLASHGGEAAGSVSARMRAGLSLYRRGEAAYLNHLHQAALHVADPAEALVELLQRKAPIAAGYHSGKSLGGCPMDHWFSAKTFDGQGLLAALAEAGWFRGKAGQRPFDRLIGFGGPMFGVFTADDRACLERWLVGTRGSLGKRISPPTSPLAPTMDSSWSMKADKDVHAAPVVSKRDLYFRMVNGHRDSTTMVAAREFVERELARARRRLSRYGSKLRLFDYRPDVFVERIATLHLEAVAERGAATRSPRLSKAECLWGLRQFAPAVLVDGCWLSGSGKAAEQDDPVHRRLLTIYADELGAGDPVRHHPAIYRGLLASDTRSDVPPADSLAFAHSPLFVDAAFDLPVFALAMGRDTQRYLPEILGLNLAIELSGLGGQYQRLAEDLAHWGIDPLIVRLHQSIDNLASGHAALAVEAIQIHMESVRLAAGNRAVDMVWRRIWSGYVSLHSVTRPFKRALLFSFLRMFWRSRLWAFRDRALSLKRERTATL